MNAADAAYQVLKEKGQPMTARELAQEILSQGLWETEGQSPDATIGARIYSDIKKKGNQSRFVKKGKGLFDLRENDPPYTIEQPILPLQPKSEETETEPEPITDPCEPKNVGKKKPTKSILYEPALAILSKEKGKSFHVGEIRQRIIKEFPDLKWSQNSGPLRAMLLSAAMKDTPIKLVEGSKPPLFFCGELRAEDDPPPPSPEEVIERAMSEADAQLKDELLQHVKDMDDFVFEELVNQLIEKLGFGNHITTPKSRDGGIDGMIYGDSLGLNVVGVQSKRYTTQNVGRGEIDKFIGALEGRNGVFVTTSSFSSEAEEKAKHTGSNSRIALIDGKKLVDLMVTHNLGVQVHKNFTLYRIDNDYFEELEG